MDQPPGPARRRGRPTGFGTDPDEVQNQSLSRALHVLDALSGMNGATMSELARSLGQSPATMHRVLATLAAHDLAESDPQTQLWHVGPGAVSLGAAYLKRNSLVERSRAAMRVLVEQTGESSNLGIERGGRVLFIDQVETPRSIRAFFPPGTVAPIHASGIGKALLAASRPDRLALLLRDAELTRFTPRTLTDIAALRDEIGRIRARGFSLDDEEKEPGMRCIAAAILDQHGDPVAGVSVSGPVFRLPDDEIARIGPLVAHAAARISRGVGA